MRSISRKISKLLPVLQVLKPALRDPQTIGAIKKTISSDDDTVFYNAPLLVLIASAKTANPFVCRDCALASQNMMLYAHSLGIGSCFIGRADFLMMSKDAKEALRLLPGHVIQCAIVFGYAPQGEGSQSVPDRRRDNIISWVR